MTQVTLPLNLAPARASNPPGRCHQVRALALRELRDALRSRWFVLYTLAFAVLGLAISFVSASSTGGVGLAGFGRTTAGLINLVLLVVPLMALTAGAGSVAGDRERGTLAYLLSQPIGRGEALMGKFFGLAGAMLACLCLGLGVCAGVLAITGHSTQPASMIWMGGLSLLLALGMLAVGLLISTLARRASVAVGTAVFVWLVLIFVSDLGLMAGAVALNLRIQELFALSLINPAQVYKMWALHAVESTLDVLGPAGLYAVEEYGRGLHAIFAGCLIAWIVLPLGAAAYIINRRSPV